MKNYCTQYQEICKDCECPFGAFADYVICLKTTDEEKTRIKQEGIDRATDVK